MNKEDITAMFESQYPLDGWTGNKVDLLDFFTLEELLTEVNKRVKQIHKSITKAPPATLNGQIKWYQELEELAKRIK